jgi:ATP-dependent HslUV protease ATP-binding subunit HslU
LTEPESALVRQYEELLATEGVALQLTDDAVKRIAEFAVAVNEGTEDIGARRLHTLMEKLLEEISFHAPDMAGQECRIDAGEVERRLGEVIKDHDVSRYIL